MILALLPCSFLSLLMLKCVHSNQVPHSLIKLLKATSDFSTLLIDFSKSQCRCIAHWCFSCDAIHSAVSDQIFCVSVSTCMVFPSDIA